MSVAWTLRRVSSLAHELIRTAQVAVFAKLFLDSAVKHLAVPDDALIKIRLKLSSELPLFTSSKDGRSTLMVHVAIPKTVQTQGVLTTQDLARPQDGVFRQVQQFGLCLCLAFSLHVALHRLTAQVLA